MTVLKWGEETLVNTNVNGDQQRPTIAALADGYVISWTDGDAAGGDGSFASVKFQRYDAAGSKLGGEVLANFDAIGQQINRDVIATDDGGFAIIWEESGGVEYRRFDANGTPLDAADRVLALPGNQFNPALTTLGTGFVMVLEDNNSGTQDIRVQRFLANGDATGAIID